jgi:hypothetical protein
MHQSCTYTYGNINLTFVTDIHNTASLNNQVNLIGDQKSPRGFYA